MRTHPIHLTANTLHDQFCRCTSCKPGADRLAANAASLFRLKVALIGLGTVVGVLLAFRLA